MAGILTTPKIGKGPGLLVLPAWWGLNSFFSTLCNRFADEGFVVFAPDYYNGKTASTIEEAKVLRSKLDQKKLFADLLKEVDELQNSDAVTGKAIGVIGFSMGARFALELSVEKPGSIGSVIVFYGTNNLDYSSASAAYLGHFAEKDDWTALSGVKKLEKNLISANRPVTFHFYPGTGHWFFEEDQHEAYVAEAANLAWTRTLDFLRQKFPG